MDLLTSWGFSLFTMLSWHQPHCQGPLTDTNINQTSRIFAVAQKSYQLRCYNRKKKTKNSTDVRYKRPWYGGEWRIQASKMKSLRATITTDQLSSILTHCTLVIVDVSLHTEILIIHGPTAGRKNMKAAWMLYSICGWLPLVVEGVLNNFESSLGFLWQVTRVKHPIDL